MQCKAATADEKVAIHAEEASELIRNVTAKIMQTHELKIRTETGAFAFNIKIALLSRIATKVNP